MKAKTDGRGDRKEGGGVREEEGSRARKGGEGEGKGR